jgi:toxin secretion/phage lysis holin
LVLSNIIDYGTGLVASKYRSETISSYKSFRGIAKKICMWLLVIVGAMIDQLLIYAGSSIGIELPITFLVACIVAVWLICNEIISILENIVDIGVELPPFLAPIVKNIKKQVEDKATIKEGSNT